MCTVVDGQYVVCRTITTNQLVTQISDQQLTTNAHQDVSIPHSEQHTRPYRLAVVSDPQLTDSYSYGMSPGSLALAATQYYSDIYMRKSYTLMQVGARQCRSCAFFFFVHTAPLPGNA